MDIQETLGEVVGRLFIISKGRRSLTLSWQLLADAALMVSQLLIQ